MDAFSNGDLANAGSDMNWTWVDTMSAAGGGLDVSMENALAFELMERFRQRSEKLLGGVARRLKQDGLFEGGSLETQCYPWAAGLALMPTRLVIPTMVDTHQLAETYRGVFTGLLNAFFAEDPHLPFVLFISELMLPNWKLAPQV
jgi:hypothetical protein